MFFSSRLFAFAFLGLFSLPLQAITFEQESSWPELLAQASAANKILFVDAYATWCGPCKMMDRDVFPDEALSAYFDEHFINVKIDMESQRGLPFAADYEVDAYPSLFFIAPDGSVLRKNVGAIDVEQLMRVGQYVKDPSSSVLATLQTRFDAGERDTSFLRELVTESMDLGDLHMAAAELLLQAVGPERVATEIDDFVVLYHLPFALESPMGQWFSANFQTLMGTFDEYVYEKLSDVIIAHIKEGVEQEDTDAYIDSALVYVEKTVVDEEIRTGLLDGIRALRQSLKEE